MDKYNTHPSFVLLLCYGALQIVLLLDYAFNNMPVVQVMLHIICICMK